MTAINLAGSWTLTRSSDSTTRPALLPGDIMSALIASGELADPYHDRNELAAQWVGREDWLLSRDFELSADFLARGDIFLEIESLDTKGEVRLNGSLIGSSSNMFTRLRLDAKAALKTGLNRLEILIGSPESAAKTLSESLPYPVPHSTYPIGSPHRNLLRKVQCMSGWDWGPCLMTGGVYDGIRLVGLDGPRIDYVTTSSTKVVEGRWELKVRAELEAKTAGRARVEVEIAGVKKNVELETSIGRSVATLVLVLDGIETWWPAGHGEQALYELRVRCSGSKSGSEPHELVKKLGFRELLVVSEKDGVGRSLSFRVNGRDEGAGVTLSALSRIHE